MTHHKTYLRPDLAGKRLVQILGRQVTRRSAVDRDHLVVDLHAGAGCRHIRRSLAHEHPAVSVVLAQDGAD